MANCKRLRWLPAIALAVLIGSAASATPLIAQEAQPAETLRWKLTNGEQLQVQFSQTMTTVSTVGGRAVRMDIEMGAECKWHVEQVAETGDATIVQTLSRLQLKLTRSDGSPPIEYDSASEERPRGAARNIAESVMPLLGTSARVTMTARGEIVEVKLLPEAEAALKELKDAGQVFTLFTPDGLTEVLRQALPLLPADGVTAGESWEDTNQTVLSFGAVAQTSQFTYRGREDKDGQSLAKIEVTSRVNVQPKADADADEKPPVKIQEQKLGGTLWFDVDAGRFRSGSLEQQVVTVSPYRTEEITVRLSSMLQFTVASAGSE